MLKIAPLVLLTLSAQMASSEDFPAALENAIADQTESCRSLIGLTQSYGPPTIRGIRLRSEDQRNGMIVIRLADNPGLRMAGTMTELPGDAK